MPITFVNVGEINYNHFLFTFKWQIIAFYFQMCNFFIAIFWILAFKKWGCISFNYSLELKFRVLHSCFPFFFKFFKT